MAFSVLALAAFAAACPTTGAGLDLGQVTVDLWQIGGPGVDANLLDAATTREVVVCTDDGCGVPTALDDATALAGTRGQTVRLTITAEGPFGTAVARTDPFVLEEGSTLRLPAILAPTGLTAIDEVAGDGRTAQAVCSDGAGRAVMVGGEEGGALSFGSWLVDRAAETVTEGPGLPDRRRFASCAIVGDDVWLSPGCDVDDSPRADLLRAPIGGTAFAAEAQVPEGQAGCGVSIAATTEGLAVLQGNRLEMRPTTGGIEARATLASARYYADLLDLGDGAVVVAGGAGSTDPLDFAPGGYIVDGSDVLEVRALAGEARLASRPRADGGREAFAFLVDEVVELDSSGVGPALITASGGSLAATAVAQMVPTGHDRFLLMPEDGETLLDISTSATTSVPLGRPGARMAGGPGGVVFILGGAAGVLVYVSPL